MHKEIEIKGEKIYYTLRRSKRAKRIRIAIYCNGDLAVTLPNSLFFTQRSAEKIIKEKSDLIIKKLDYFKKHPSKYLFKNSRQEFIKYKKIASDLAKEKIDHFNKTYNFNVNRISIRNQRTRWGSCSKKGNLNFNYKIALLPEKLADYIIVHELCHLGEFNHSKKFWELVSKTIPKYQIIRKEIKRL